MRTDERTHSQTLPLPLPPRLIHDVHDNVIAEYQFLLLLECEVHQDLLHLIELIQLLLALLVLGRVVQLLDLGFTLFLQLLGLHGPERHRSIGA